MKETRQIGLHGSQNQPRDDIQYIVPLHLRYSPQPKVTYQAHMVCHELSDCSPFSVLWNG